MVEGSMRIGQETGGWKEGSLYLEVGERPRNSSSGVRNVIFRFKANSRSLQEKSFFFPAAHFFSLWKYLKIFEASYMYEIFNCSSFFYFNLFASQLLFQLRLQRKMTCFCPPLVIISGYVYFGCLSVDICNVWLDDYWWTLAPYT